jgi:hypothetical protein
MAVVDKAGSVNNLSSVDTANSLIGENVTNGGKLKFIRETIEVAAADDNGSVYRVARIPANAVLKEITIACDAITGGTDYDLGFYDVPETNSGAVIDKDALMDGQTLASASRVIDGLQTVAIENLHKKAWELASISAATTKYVDIALTGNAVGTAAGTITVTVVYTLD